MVTYLQDLCWSDVVRCGRDNRKEFNLAVSVIARLVLKGGQAGYLSGPGFVPAFERFVRDWQDPETGFFGVTYIIDNKGNEITTTDLSLTFHMVRYALIWCAGDSASSTLCSPSRTSNIRKAGSKIQSCRITTIMMWSSSSPRLASHADQRRQPSQEVAKMLDWCLEYSVRDTGEIINPRQGRHGDGLLVFRCRVPRHARASRRRPAALVQCYPITAGDRARSG